MKFAKELENELVPEWRVKYLDYKQGKKKISAVRRALRNAHPTPKMGGRWRTGPDSTLPSRLPYTHYDFTADHPETVAKDVAGHGDRHSPLSSRPPPPRRQSMTVLMSTPPIPVPERQPLKGDSQSNSVNTTYGSIVATPPQPSMFDRDELQSLKLPDPAIEATSSRQESLPPGPTLSKIPSRSDAPPAPDAYHVGSTLKPPRKRLGFPHKIRFHRAVSTPGKLDGPPSARRLISNIHLGTPNSADVPMEAFEELDNKQAEFFRFLDGELHKIDSFYDAKEKEASERLDVLRAQLHEMRDRRMDEIESTNHEVHKSTLENAGVPTDKNGHLAVPGIFKPLGNLVARGTGIGRTSTAMAKLGSPSKQVNDADQRRDYVKRQDTSHEVPYRSAKRKLKVALQEFYRGLELLKSYSLVNRTAFRKINKKYDKAVNARPTGRYVAEKVNRAHFVRSDNVENYIVAVEDLYARYFERGHRKVAVGKLRSKLHRAGDHSQTSFRNGIWLSSGIALGIQGCIYGWEHLFFGSPMVRLQASFLLQLYAGYFLALLLYMLFTIDCRIWARSKINYVFVFEFDSRHILEWMQLAEMSCFFLFLNGLFLFLNFRQHSEDAMFLYWPVILIGLTLVALALPARTLHYRSRKWFGYSLWRLLLAGWYPVEFRDFFFGDMFCSLTYMMGNIEVFFCLYSGHWSNPSRCNSSNSRLLGFLTTLPAVWRAFQCLRRYRDSGNWFPHLANCAKYTLSILYYLSLSLWRMDRSSALHALFIFFALTNALYCSVWDIGMDWSLGNAYSRHPLLRDNLGFRRIWTYYVAMTLDPLLRFAWIFYALFPPQSQHSTLVSFLVALAEILRRALWAVFRVENEHCTNVQRHRASRDCPLPYSVDPSSSPELTAAHPDGATTTGGPPADIESQPVPPATPSIATPGSTSLRLRRTRTPAEESTPIRRGLRRVGTLINQAHAEDFERKTRPGVVGGEEGAEEPGGSSDEDDDDDDEVAEGARLVSREDEEEDMGEAREIVERAQGS